MNGSTVYGLSNEDYHHTAPYSDYLSSSQLKLYLKSPRHFRYMLENPEEEKSDALRFGSLFHMAIELYKKYGTIDAFYRAAAIFQPPVNERTGQSYGSTTKAYSEAYAQFLADNKDKQIATREEAALVDDMVGTLVRPSVGGDTARQVLKLLKWGESEVSHFIEYEGCKFKWRPDLETPRKIVDWKTVSTDDLSEDGINRIILKYGYHISAAFYQFFEHERSGIWKQFILVLVSKAAPHDCVMVDMCNYGYRYYPEADIVSVGPGAMEFKKLLDLHIKCTKENHWPGAEQAIPDNNGVRILEIQPPRYYSNKFIELE